MENEIHRTTLAFNTKPLVAYNTDGIKEAVKHLIALAEHSETARAIVDSLLMC